MTSIETALLACACYKAPIAEGVLHTTKAAYADDELGVDVVMNADSNGIWVAGFNPGHRKDRWPPELRGFLSEYAI
ncbi:MAG: hypothetical protein M3247_07410 [Thermoproteota archaeon]|nr:hypothetical protein [Thermoproteota archaeon]